MPQENEQAFFFISKSEFRKWLTQYHTRETVLWVGFYKKNAGLPSITWPESVDEALCFGWIDGLRKSIDDKSYKIRFTPRKKNSHWSAVNLKRYSELEESGLITPAGKKAYLSKKLSNTQRASYEQKTVELKEDYLKQIKSNPNAFAYYCTLSPYVLRASNWYIMSAKRQATQLRRLEILIKSCESGEKIPAFTISKKNK